jgi:ribosome-binding protein aMBF1 (putative translation factor)
MSGLTKTRPTHDSVRILFEGKRRKRLFVVPKGKAENIASLLTEYETEESVSMDEVFKDLLSKYGKVGSIIRGYRIREGLSQVELADKLSIRQAELSQIENGKRTVGKTLAKRFAAVFNTDYRNFL